MKSPEVFYLQVNGEQRGPYTIHHIDHLLNSGLITEEAMFWREGLEQWQPVTRLVVLRKRKRRWKRPAIPIAILAVLAIFLRIFGPITLDGWREASQTAYTESAAYWRSRDFARQSAEANGNVIQFLAMKNAQIEMHPPDSAAVLLRGKIIGNGGASRDVEWHVILGYDDLRKEWTKRDVQELTPN